MTVPVAERVPNRALRVVRNAMRLSQSEFAVAVRSAGEVLGEPNDCNKRLVQKWESGEHATCRPAYRRALQSVTRRPYDQLGFAGATAGLVQPEPSMATAAIARSLAVPGSGSAESAQRMRYALATPEIADLEEVVLTETSTAQLFDLEAHRPARLLAPMVQRHIETVAALLAGTRRDHLRRRLAATGGASLALAGWLAFDEGAPVAAAEYLDSAAAAARYASDGPLLACVLTYQSYLAEEAGDLHGAWHLAHQALSHVGAIARARAWVALRSAQLAASVREQGLALADMEMAVKLAAALPPVAADTEAPVWARFFDRCVVFTMAASVHVRLGDQRAARESINSVLRTLSGERIKTRAIGLAETALVAAYTGDVDLLCECAPKAAELARFLECTLAQRTLRALPPLLAPLQGNSAVRALAELFG